MPQPELSKKEQKKAEKDRKKLQLQQEKESKKRQAQEDKESKKLRAQEEKESKKRGAAEPEPKPEPTADPPLDDEPSLSDEEPPPPPPLAPDEEPSAPQDLAGWLAARGLSAQLSSVQATMVEAEIPEHGIVPLLSGMDQSELDQFMASCAVLDHDAKQNARFAQAVAGTPSEAQPQPQPQPQPREQDQGQEPEEEQEEEEEEEAGVDDAELELGLEELDDMVDLDDGEREEVVAEAGSPEGAEEAAAPSFLELFNQLDEEGNGFLTITELRNTLGDEAEAMMETADINRDGIITYEKFELWARTAFGTMSEALRMLDVPEEKDTLSAELSVLAAFKMKAADGLPTQTKTDLPEPEPEPEPDPEPDPEPVDMTEQDLLEDLEDLDDWKMQSDEVTQRLWKLFQEIDVEGTGALDRDDVARLSQNMGADLTEMELDQAMGEMDADGSGEADFEEFHTWWVNVGDEKSKWALLLDAKDDRRERELRAAFEYV